jgi:hypothetical protein
MKKDIRKVIRHILKEIRLKSGDKNSGKLYAFKSGNKKDNVRVYYRGKDWDSKWPSEYVTGTTYLTNTPYEDDVTFIKFLGDDSSTVDEILKKIGLTNKDYVEPLWNKELRVNSKYFELINTPVLYFIPKEEIETFTNEI